MNNTMFSATQKRGKIKWYNNTKGFGFITGEDGEEAFLHYSFIKNLDNGEEIREEDPVLYEIELKDKGIMAKNVYLENKRTSFNNSNEIIGIESTISMSCDDELDEEINLVKQLLYQYSMDLNDSKKVKGLLADCVENKALRYVLIWLYDEGVVENLLNADDVNIVKHRYLKILKEQYAFNERYAEVGLNIWCDILKGIQL